MKPIVWELLDLARTRLGSPPARLTMECMASIRMAVRGQYARRACPPQDRDLTGRRAVQRMSRRSLSAGVTEDAIRFADMRTCVNMISDGTSLSGRMASDRL